MSESDVWNIWIDTGGTFTDCIARDPEGRLRRCKVLSSGALRDRVASIGRDRGLRLEGAAEMADGWLVGFRISALGRGTAAEVLGHDGTTGVVQVAAAADCGLEAGAAIELQSGEEAPLLAARMITGTPLAKPLPPIALRLATTRGTNALLERRGARTVHFTTAGFEDLLSIADQHRPDLFALDIQRPAPLPEEVVGVPGRVSADGRILEPFDPEAAGRTIEDLASRGYRCASIALLNSHRNPQHELKLERLLRGAGFRYVARSSALGPFQGLLRRSQTAATDAYLGPVITEYLHAIDRSLGADRVSFHVMTSAGGLVGAGSYRSTDSLLSGPAGGVVGAAMVGRCHGRCKVIAFDMGGTSTDVSRFDGDLEYVFKHRVGPVELAAPALAIETVAAGGGSVCRVDQGRLFVGPQSAGADPGPASYGAGGPLTLTDVNLLLGRLVAQRFPIPIDVDAAGERLGELVAELPEAGRASDEEILEGLLRIADERMAEAIRHISVRKGMDPADYSLVAFGGAGGQHACQLASLLGIAEVLLPGDAGLLSARGLGDAVVERFAQRELLRSFDGICDRLDGWFAELEREARDRLAAEGPGGDRTDPPRRIVEMRYVGQDAVLELEPLPGDDLRRRFEDAYYRLFSYRPKGRDIEVVSLRVVVRSARREPLEAAGETAGGGREAVPVGHQRCHLDGRWREVPRYEIAEMAAGARIAGPALIQQRHSAVVLPQRWRAEADGAGGLRLRIGDRRREASTAARRQRPASVELELMSHRFQGIAREMGELLQRTAISTNIKEREDFSCTILDPLGRLVVNAPHIPVHLGAMGLCVRELTACITLQAGDVAVTNHPAFGGSHLPDVTLVAPVHAEGDLIGYVACRAHHAEIGGVRPGSVPPAAASLEEEGVVIPPMLLVAGGEPCWQRVEDLLVGGRHPTRSVSDNLADLRAMLAAILRGRQALARLASTAGRGHVLEHMDALRRHAAEQIRDALERLPDGEMRGHQRLDDGWSLAATLTVRGRGAELDFSGTGRVHPGNLNATPAIVHSVVMYVMRLLVDEDLPLNEGLLDPLRIRIPPGLLNPDFSDDPARCPAVVGGNVETSQRLVDLLVGILELAACSQGTMNNLSFGDRSFGYYETVGGGAGATRGRHGASGVHTHMTNTRITDPEVLEHRYPVRMRRFALRRGSGGAGKWRGGDGLVREIEFLAPLLLSILSQHRAEAPYGLAGGGGGAVGRQWVVRADGRREDLDGIDGCEVGPGDRFVLETPGGGGYGEPNR